MGEVVHYFAYGSNMSKRRIEERIAGVAFVGAGRLGGYEMVVGKKSITDGSAKCGLYRSGQNEVETWGAVFALCSDQIPQLDRCEHNGIGYQRQKLGVQVDDLGVIDVFTYVALNRQAELPPFTWYLYHVLIGAQEAGLPEEYVQMLLQQSSIVDENGGRQRRELAIYSAGEIAEIEQLIA